MAKWNLHEVGNWRLKEAANGIKRLRLAIVREAGGRSGTFTFSTPLADRVCNHLEQHHPTGRGRLALGGHGPQFGPSYPGPGAQFPTQQDDYFADDGYDGYDGYDGF